MATPTALCGVGIAAMAAAVLGNELTTATATGTGSQTNSVAVKSSMVKLVAAGGTDSFILPASDVFSDLIGKPIFLTNASGTTAVVFCPVGATMNGSSNGSFSIPNAKFGIAIQISKGVWFGSPLP